MSRRELFSPTGNGQGFPQNSGSSRQAEALAAQARDLFGEDEPQTEQRRMVQFLDATKGRPYRELSNAFCHDKPFAYALPEYACSDELPHVVKCEFAGKVIMLTKAALMNDHDAFRTIALAKTPSEAKALGRKILALFFFRQLEQPRHVKWLRLRRGFHGRLRFRLHHRLHGDVVVGVVVVVVVVVGGGGVCFCC